MTSRSGRRGALWVALGLVLLSGGVASTARAQAPSLETFPNAPSVPPPTPSPAVPPPATTPAPPPATREAQLEERIRQLEATVTRLAAQIERSSGGSGGPPPASSPPAAPPPSAPGQSLPANPPASARFQVPATLESRAGKVKFGPGFEIRTDDDEFIFQFHNLTQFDYRGYQQGGQDPVHDTFGFPRQWFMFSGRVTKPFGYFVSFAHGFDNLSMLDAFVDYGYDPKLQLRIGRFKTPFTYEFLVEPVQGLLSPERSVFFNNFGQNRDEGIMAFGRLFDNKLDYAAGFFNGARNILVDQNDSKAVSAFVNWRPFADAEDSLLENFNIGGSVFATHFNNLPVPQTLRTAVPTTGNTTIGVPFLTFNSDVREWGDSAFWDLHLAWYYQQLSVIAEWGSGAQSYASTNDLSARTHLPVQSFYVQAGYFLTGETASSVGIVKPLHPFDLRGENLGLGAIEPTVRYAYMDVGREVFTNKLADPTLWSNRVSVLDVGVNWHLTQYIKAYLGWQHSEFGDPVRFAPDRKQLTSDQFWARMQLFF